MWLNSVVELTLIHLPKIIQMVKNLKKPVSSILGLDFMLLKSTGFTSPSGIKVKSMIILSYHTKTDTELSSRVIHFVARLSTQINVR